MPNVYLYICSYWYIYDHIYILHISAYIMKWDEFGCNGLADGGKSLDYVGCGCVYRLLSVGVVGLELRSLKA